MFVGCECAFGRSSLQLPWYHLMLYQAWFECVSKHLLLTQQKRSLWASLDFFFLPYNKCKWGKSLLFGCWMDSPTFGGNHFCSFSTLLIITYCPSSFHPVPLVLMGSCAGSSSPHLLFWINPQTKQWGVASQQEGSGFETTQRWITHICFYSLVFHIFSTIKCTNKWKHMLYPARWERRPSALLVLAWAVRFQLLDCIQFHCFKVKWNFPRRTATSGWFSDTSHFTVKRSGSQ